MPRVPDEGHYHVPHFPDSAYPIHIKRGRWTILQLGLFP